MRKIAIINQKGGVAKTTTTVNLAAGLSREDKKVLIIDLDAQGSIKSCFNAETEKDIHDLLLGGAELPECIRKLGKNLDVITSCNSLIDSELDLAKLKNKESVLKEKLAKLNSYDYVIMDCPPSLGLITKNALMFADEVFIPVSTDVLGIKSLNATISLIQDINQNLEANVRITKIIPTLYDKRNSICKRILSQINNEFYEITTEPIRINSKLKEAPLSGQSIFKYAKHSRGAKDYLHLVRSVMHDEKKFKELEEKIKVRIA